jgi:hypothetical protein
VSGKRAAAAVSAAYLDVDDEPLPPDVTNPKKAPIRQVMSWAEKIRLPQERAMDNEEPYFEVHFDGHRFVSLLTIDVTGDNTLVYMTGRETDRLIKKLQRARAALPQRRKTTTGRRKKK